jgi:hypothetical protein
MRSYKIYMVTMISSLLVVLTAESSPLKWNMKGIRFCQEKEQLSEILISGKYQDLNPESLSSFIMLSRFCEEDLEAYKMKIMSSMGSPEIRAKSLKRNRLISVVSRSDISEVSWQKQDKSSAKGQFNVSTKCGFSATFLFKAKKQGRRWGITHLAVAHKTKPGIENGYTVFDEKGPGSYFEKIKEETPTQEERDNRKSVLTEAYDRLQEKSQ